MRVVIHTISGNWATPCQRPHGVTSPSRRPATTPPRSISAPYKPGSHRRSSPPCIPLSADLLVPSSRSVLQEPQFLAEPSGADERSEPVATCGAAVCTGNFPILDNLLLHPAVDRRARVHGSTPYLASPPVVFLRRRSSSDLTDHMEYQWECYQLGHGGELRFEKELKQLVEYLGHPYPEFFGTSFNNQLGGSPRWEISADLGRKLEAPMAPPNRNQDAMMQMLQMMMEDREATRAERQANLAALQQIAQNNQGHGNHDHPGLKLKNFQNTNPPMFSKTEEPLDADDWLQTMENNLEVAGVEAAEKVLFATHYLSGPARAWWTSARAMNAGQMMTWEDFKLKFSKYHVPQGPVKKMRGSHD
ncbi:hypothetical protein QYE76_000066 [Lolium multiflorum]|uniref:Retrotransposon gag domain-containing protein n=1 Tax=Lolium multiflorum TaxID=4521 RepID=A0AAD8PIA8_LOLMU|nr:hypothetical protein QYE76_000066 [Lolium multiflorum]